MRNDKYSPCQEKWLPENVYEFKDQSFFIKLNYVVSTRGKTYIMLEPIYSLFHSKSKILKENIF